MPGTGQPENGGGKRYDSATNTFRPISSTPLPLPKARSRKPRLPYDTALPGAKPFSPIPKAGGPGSKLPPLRTTVPGNY